MKKILIFYFAMFVYIASNAQGWIGNSTSNSMYPVNSNLNKTPINIGIGTDAPSEQLHTTLGVRFEGLTKNDSQNRVVVQNATGKLFWRDASTFGGSNNWSLIGNGNATNPGVAVGQNYLGTNSNHRLVFATGGLNSTNNQIVATERMTIMNNSGFIGVGTQNPSFRFHVIENTPWNATTSTAPVFCENNLTGAGTTGTVQIAKMGVFGALTVNTTGTLVSNSRSYLSGLVGQFNKIGDNKIVTMASAIASSVGLAGTDTVFELASIRASAPEVHPFGRRFTGNIQNFYGLRIEDVSLPGNAGLSVANQITNRYGLYQAGASEINFFAGSVGIGVVNPSEQLHSNSGVRFSGLINLDTLNRIIVQDNNGKLFWRNASTLGGSNNWSLTGNAGTNPANNFLGTRDNQRLVFRTNNTEKMTILSNGYIGIGINNPVVQMSNSSLHAGNSAGFGTTVANGMDWASGAQGYVSSFYNSDTSNFENNGVLIKTRNTRAGSKVLTVNSGQLVGGNDLFTILGNGNVGVGTNAPNQSLHILNGALMLETPITGNNGILFKETGTTASNGQWGIQYNNDCNVNLKGLNFWRPGASNGILYLADNNNVGIGTCSPSQRLHVAGNVLVNGTFTTSDQRYKKEIESIKSPLDLISQIGGKTYYFKTEEFKEKNFESNKQYGFIAQEIEKIIPEIVFTDSEGYKSVNYTSVVPVLVEAIKELNTKVEKQNNAVIENEALKSEISALKSENQIFKDKFELLEKSISLLCESGCAGLEKAKQNATDADILYQSIPNPTDNEALINFYLSKKYNNASIQINSLEGKSMETIVLDGTQGKGSVKIQLGQYAAQTYFYSLIVDNKVVDTKKLTVIR